MLTALRIYDIIVGNSREYLLDNFLSGLSTEFYAASYFAEQGYKIYWPMETQSRADFLIEKDNQYLKIQVKKATWSLTGKFKYLQCRLKNRNQHSQWYEEGDYDLLVIVDKPRIWLAKFEEVNHLVSLCLDGTKPGYEPRSELYDPRKWLVQDEKRTESHLPTITIDRKGDFPLSSNRTKGVYEVSEEA